MSAGAKNVDGKGFVDGGGKHVDFSKAPCPLWPHQREGAEALITHPAFALLDQVGLGKTAQVVSAACYLFEQRVIDTLMIVAPGAVRSVWADPNPLLGEFVKHVWPGMPYEITEFRSGHTKLPQPKPGVLQVVCTNFELIREGYYEEPAPGASLKKRPKFIFTHLPKLIEFAVQRKTWLVADEAWAIKGPGSKQTKATYFLRIACERFTALNGTPGSPEDTFTMFQTMDPSILDCANFFQFRGRYCVMGGWGNKKVVGYKNMEDYQRRVGPHAVRRDKSHLKLPPVLPPVNVYVTLTPKTWGVYCSMRDSLVAQLESGGVSIARQAGVKTMRLAQILAGFLGGIESSDELELFQEVPTKTLQEVGREKLDAVNDLILARDMKVVVWCCFRPEAARMAAALGAAGRVVHTLVGNQTPDGRDAAKRAFAPGTDETRPAILVGHQAAGGAGINLASASLAIYASNGWSLKDRKQSEGRLDRPGQTQPVQFINIVATGPKGQKTLDHAIIAALRAEEDVANWTADTWLKTLTDE